VPPFEVKVKPDELSEYAQVAVPACVTVNVASTTLLFSTLTVPVRCDGELFATTVYEKAGKELQGIHSGCATGETMVQLAFEENDHGHCVEEAVTTTLPVPPPLPIEMLDGDTEYVHAGAFATVKAPGRVMVDASVAVIVTSRTPAAAPVRLKVASRTEGFGFTRLVPGMLGSPEPVSCAMAPFNLLLPDSNTVMG
jgi:hypothetical protein